MLIGSLFSGAGGLDMAVEAVFGGRTVWHSEIDKAASKVLAHRFPGVPNLGSVTEIDWAAVEPVDVLCGGFPCQDVSAAGKRAGIKDGTRSGLWAVFAEAIDVLRPQFVVIENVRGLLSATAHRTVEGDGRDHLEHGAAGVGDRSDRPVLRALGAVLGDLSDLGYDAQWSTVAAASVGAPHRRERVFILAVAADAGGAGERLDTGESARLVRGSDAAVSGDEPGVALLPTPAARDFKGTDTAGDHNRHSPGMDAVTYHFPALLPTPNASDGSGGGQHPDKRKGHHLQLIDCVLLSTPSAADSAGGPSQFQRNTLPLNAEVTLLPTPCVVDRLASGEMTLDEWDESRRSQKERGVGSFGPRGDSLGAAILRVDGGTVNERPDYSTARDERGMELLLHGTALLPTPAAQDGNGGGRYSSEGHQSTQFGAARLITKENDAASEGRPSEGLRDLRDTADPQAVCERPAGGSQRVLEADPLLTGVCEQPTGSAAEHSRVACEECNPGGELRGMRDNGKAACSPQGSQPGQQRSCESCGAVRQLPSEIALAGGPGLSGAAHSGVDWGKYEPAIRRWERVLGRPAPAPTEPNKNGNPRLAAEFSSWLMGWPAGWVTDPDIGISRNDQLRIVGNGVCTQQAIAALRYLLASCPFFVIWQGDDD